MIDKPTRKPLCQLQYLLFLGCLVVGLCRTMQGQGVLAFSPGAITTFAGVGPTGYSGKNIPYIFEAMAVSPSGTLYLTDGVQVFVADIPSGAMTAIAGTANGGGYGGDNGPAINATFDWITSLATDGAGNLYIADAGNQVIRKVANGIVTTVAGSAPNGTASYAGDWGNGGPALNAVFMNLSGIAVDSAGDIFVSDGGTQDIRKITKSSGVIDTVATASSVGPPIAVDTVGNLYVADSSNTVWMWDATKNARITVAGSGGSTGYAGDNGPATAAKLNGPAAMTVDAYGNLYLFDSGNGAIREVDLESGFIYAVVQSGGNSLASDSDGNLYLQNMWNISMVTASTGSLSNVAAVAGASYDASPTGLAIETPLPSLAGITVNSTGDVYIAETYGEANSTIQKIGSGTGVLSSINSANYLSQPRGITADSSGKLYIQSRYYSGGGYSGQVGLFDPASGTFSTSQSINNQLCDVNGAATDASGNVYVADSCFQSIFKYQPSTNTTTLVAGQGSAQGDGPALSAALNYPNGLAVDRSGNLYFDDGCAVRVIYSSGSIPNPNHISPLISGNIYTVAGSVACSSGDPSPGDGGLATGATLESPDALAVDASGNLYIADYGRASVRMVSASTGIISTVFDGSGSSSFFYPCLTSLAVDPAGNLYIADTCNQVISEYSIQNGALVFSPQRVGTTSDPQILTITNVGTAEVDFPAYSDSYLPDGFSVTTGGSCQAGSGWSPLSG